MTDPTDHSARDGSPEPADPAEPPNRGYVNGEPIPDLAKIPREEWVDALVPLSDFARSFVAARNGQTGDPRAVLVAVGEAAAVKSEREHAARAATTTPPRLPAARLDPADAAPQASRQLNVRLAPELYDTLAAMAADHGVRPVQLARLLIGDGVRRYAYEQRRLSGP